MEFAFVELEPVFCLLHLSSGGYLKRVFPAPQPTKNWFIPGGIWVTVGWVTPALYHSVVSSVIPKGTGLSDRRRVAPGPQPVYLQLKVLRALDMVHTHNNL